MIQETFAAAAAFVNDNRELILDGALGILAVSVLALLLRMQRLYRLVKEWVTYSPSPSEEMPAAAQESSRYDDALESLRRELQDERHRVTALQKLFIETKEKSVMRLELLERSLATAETRLTERLDNLLRRPLPPVESDTPRKERVRH
jgi:hypothetical protein